MARARALSLPAAMGDLCAALRLPERKDKDGHKVMLKLCKPRSRDPLVFWTPETAPDDFRTLYNYCLQDGIAERGLHLLLPPLSDKEREVWLLDQEINNRGVQLDMPAVRRAFDLIEQEKAELSARVFKLTGGASTATQRDVLLSWLQGEGVQIAGLTKAEVARAVADPALKDTAAKAVLEVRREAAKGSTAKLKAMIASACDDWRARGLFVFLGANTGRWAGRRVQTQNMPRPKKGFKPEDAAEVIGWLAYSNAARIIRFMYGSVMDALSWSLRSFIIARPGCRLIAADFANIEGRVLAWLAGEEWKLDAFREYDAGRGTDLYILAFCRAFGMDVKDVDDARRQIGKVMELALGYQGGIGSFISMGANYGVVPDDIATATKAITPPDVWENTMKRLPALGTRFRAGLEPDVWCGLRIVVDAWRAAHPRVKDFWNDLEAAAIAAVREPGKVFRVGHIAYRKEGDFLKCRLPSGRALAYPYADIKSFPSMQWESKRDELKHAIKEAIALGPEGVATAVRLEAELAEHEKPENIEWVSSLIYWGVSSKAGSAKNWRQQRAYGGLLCENVTQAVARDCLAEGMLRLKAAGYRIVMHVHDEILCEEPHDKHSLTDLAHKMCAQEEWADGLPVVAAGWESGRYRK
jgi:DNA polymerase